MSEGTVPGDPSASIRKLGAPTVGKRSIVQSREVALLAG
jgi:hypothetical protein